MRISNLNLALLSRQSACVLATACLLNFYPCLILAGTHYVVPPGTAGVTPADPYTNWATAGTSIIDVVKSALTNAAPRTVWVTNGAYVITNWFRVNANLALQSVNGRDNTILTADRTSINSNIYIWFHEASNVLDGFTISNFYVTNASAVFVTRPNPMIIQNCLFVDNSAVYRESDQGQGGAIKFNNAYSVGWTTMNRVTNCIFRNNYAEIYGGGISMYYGVHNLNIEGCRFESNRVSNSSWGWGGGCRLGACTNLTVSNCVFINNRGVNRGGGLYFGGTDSTNQNVVNCTFIDNAVSNSGGAIFGTGSNILIRNCLVVSNRSETNTAGGVYINNGLVENCTIASNYAKVAGGGLYIDGSATGRNNIVYFNTAPSAANFTNTTGNTGLNYCCVTPSVEGTGNITDDPRLIDLAGGNYRLQANSPCMNTGTNQDWMTGAVDLDGRIRIRYGIVDMGAYEAIWEGTICHIGF